MTNLQPAYPETEKPHPLIRLLADSRHFLGLRPLGREESKRNVKAKQAALPASRQRMHDEK